MPPPVEIRDRSKYKRRELLKIDPRRTVVPTVEEFKAKVQAAKVLAPVVLH